MRNGKKIEQRWHERDHKELERTAWFITHKNSRHMYSQKVIDLADAFLELIYITPRPRRNPVNVPKDVDRRRSRRAQARRKGAAHARRR